jgi:hypothetical protein
MSNSQQSGAGLPHFQSTVAFQRGHGLGGVLGRLFRSVIPLLRKPVVGKTLRRIGRATLRTGLNAAGESLAKGVPLKQSLRTSAKAQGQRLIDLAKRDLDPKKKELKRKPKKTIATAAVKRRKTQHHRSLDIFDF